MKARGQTVLIAVATAIALLIAPGAPAATVTIAELAAGDQSPPVPTVDSVFPPSGSSKGGTKVTIRGHGFTGATAVRFGALPATRLTVISDSSIRAVSPHERSGVTVDITVTAPGGQSAPTLEDQFTYIDVCVVPNLSGKKRKAARRALKKAHCRLGKVSPKGQKTGRVKHQSRKQGMVLPAGTKVNIRLG